MEVDWLTFGGQTHRIRRYCSSQVKLTLQTGVGLNRLDTGAVRLGFFLHKNNVDAVRPGGLVQFDPNPDYKKY